MSTVTLQIPSKYEKKYWLKFIEDSILKNLEWYFFQIELENEMEESKSASKNRFHNL